jgi:hypothetical protein
MDWVRQAVGDGLEALIALRLKNAPAEDTMEYIADIWLRAFRQRVFIRETDEPRIRAAFDRIFGRIREWPAPLDVIELMPPRPERLKLPPPKVSAEEHAENVSRVKEMIAVLMGKWP